MKGIQAKIFLFIQLYLILYVCRVYTHYIYSNIHQNEKYTIKIDMKYLSFIIYVRQIDSLLY